MFHQERLEKGIDHCGSEGSIFDLGTLISNGIVHDPFEPGLALTRKYIYAVGTGHIVRIGIDGQRGSPDAVKHESLFHNEPVLAAGEVFYRDGIIVYMNDRSGSYATFGKIQTDTRFVGALLEAIDGLKAPLDLSERRRLMDNAVGDLWIMQGGAYDHR